MKIVQISDTHISHRGGPTTENFRRLTEHLNEVVRPDLIINSGDVVVIHPDNTNDRAHARELHDALNAPLLVVPGNHDVGEPGTSPWAGLAVTDERIAAFEATWGPGHWRHDIDGVILLGINSELLGSGLEREASQWRWLENTVAELPAGVPVLLFLHKPVWTVVEGPTEHQFDIGNAASERLLGLFEETDLRAVGTGHLHRYRQKLRGDVIEVWAPSTAFISEDDLGLPEGRDEVGYIEYVIEGGEVTVTDRSVPGMVNVTPHEVPDVTDMLAALSTT